jgi:hypothetical protein
VQLLKDLDAGLLLLLLLPFFFCCMQPAGMLQWVTSSPPSLEQAC